MGRPRSRPPGSTPFAQWLRGLIDSGRLSYDEISACTWASRKTVNDWLIDRGPNLTPAVQLAIEWRLGELPDAPPKRQVTVPEMRDLFERWVDAVGEVNVLGFDLWAAMEAGFRNGITRAPTRQPLQAGPEDTLRTAEGDPRA